MKAFEHQKYSLKRMTQSNIIFDMSDPGTGKTFVQIMAFAQRRRKKGKCALVLATRSLLKSAWWRDFKKFAPDMKVSVAYATNRKDAFAEDADVYVTNHDAVKELVKFPKKFWLKFDTIIIDESTAFKHATSQRSKAAAKLVQYFPYRSLLSGTPTSNGILDIWHQVYLLDDGHRLGKSYYGFRAAACVPVQQGKNAKAIQWIDKTGVEEVVAEILKGITIRHKFEDCVDIPENHRYAIPFTPSDKNLAIYDDMQDFHFANLKKTGVTAVNGAVVYGKLLQIACLAKGTEVFTNSGWKAIELVSSHDELWDGIEWVSCYGSTCSGYTNVIDCDGVNMTHDHNVLTISGWITAKEIQNGNADGRFNRTTVRTPNGFEALWGKQQKKYSLANAMSMWKSNNSHWFQFKKWKSTLSKIMRMQSQGDFTTSQRNTSSKQYSNVLSLGQHQITMQQPKRQRLQKLWWTGNNSLQKMGKIIRKFFGRYATNLQAWFNFRPQKQQQRLFKSKLCLAHSARTIEQYQSKYLDQYPQRQNDHCSSSTRIQSETNHNSSTYCARQQRYSSSCKVAVYDIVNSGPRHCFTVRGKTGKIFIAHNSGAVYDDSGHYTLLDSSRYSFILDLVEERKHCIVFYNWEHQRDELVKEATKRGISFAVYDGKVSDKNRDQIVEDFQDGQYRVLFAHPQSAGHGLTLTRGVATIFASPTHNLEHFLQGLKRIHRIGQTQKTETILVIAEGTIDERVWTVCQMKDAKQKHLLQLVEPE